MDPRVYVLLAGIAGVMGLQGPAGDGNAERRANDFRYTPDPRMARLVAGAHRSTFADLLWLRVMPDMARHFHDREMKKRWLRASTAVITDLEPSFGTVYRYGAAYLTIHKADDEAIALLEEGVRKNPDSAGMQVELAMQYWMSKQDRARTIEHLEAAAKLPGCDTLSLSMLAAMRVEGGEDLLSLVNWAQLKDDDPDPGVRLHATAEYERTKLLIAKRCARDFEKAHGRPAKDAAELAAAHLADERVAKLVFDGIALDVRGIPQSAKFEELDRERTRRDCEEWARRIHDDSGRWPRLSEYGMPAPPAGFHWTLVDGRCSLARD